ncbi:MAG: 50S ribosomal protein L14e [Candidatus Altiarchaeales archaeon]|nr:50S ribosomal protein L14e [Candidatus Altiarchaeales archaeon]MBD3416461.1 50S ribosomal protein L14e [Candidatus Altiarchaeales archaeon]
MLCTKMALLDVGRVCKKTRGRDAGEFCVITGKTDGKFTVEGARARKKKVSGSQLEPTPWVVDAKDPAKELSSLGLA